MFYLEPSAISAKFDEELKKGKKGLLHKLSTVCAYMMVLTGYILFDTSTETISKMEYRMIVIDAKETSSKKRTHIVTQCIIWECAHFYNGRWPALNKKKNMENTKRTKKKMEKNGNNKLFKIITFFWPVSFSRCYDAIHISSVWEKRMSIERIKFYSNLLCARFRYVQTCARTNNPHIHILNWQCHY